MPREFVATFEVTTPLVIAPLIARQQVIGLLVADNKFTQAEISERATSRRSLPRCGRQG